MRILVIGINIRHIAASATRSGHEVIAVDCYCDLDLERIAKETHLLPLQGAKELIPGYIERFHPDAVVLGSGLEESLVHGVQVLNNPAKMISKISDKLWQARWLEENGFPFIKTQVSPEDLPFPFIVKPRKGAGGVCCRLVGVEDDLRMDEGLIAQELVSGKPVSVSVIGNGQEARAIAVNEQLIGASWTGAHGFRYSGNITPLFFPHHGIAEMAEEIIAKLGLLGSNGVDFMLTETGPVVVEINARFQGSLDTVEMATGFNVFEAHLQSFHGLLPERPVVRFAAGRAIIYASHDVVIKDDLVWDWVTDIPRPGSRMNRDDPVLSILAKGQSRDEVLSLLIRRAGLLRETLMTKRQRE